MKRHEKTLGDREGHETKCWAMCRNEEHEETWRDMKRH